jgi:nitrogen regulatory protein P-II 1
MTQMTYLTDAWIITCVVSTATKNAGKMLLAARDFGAKGALGYHARGFGARERLGKLGIAVETEKDVINVLVSSDQRDSVFEAMFRAGQLDRPSAGFMYMTKVEKMAAYIPESIMKELQEAGKVRSAL